MKDTVDEKLPCESEKKLGNIGFLLVQVSPYKDLYIEH